MRGGAATGRSAEVPPTVDHRVGLVAWPHFGDDAFVERLVRQLKETGLHRLRFGISWADCERPGGRAWYGGVLERLAGVAEILPCFHYTPPSLGIEPTTASPPRDPKAYADFLDAFVGEHGGRFEWVELWNEPNNRNDWDFRLDQGWGRLCAMIGGAAHWMRRLGKKTVLGGCCPTDPALLRLFHGRGVLDLFDAVGVHAFPGTWSHHWRGWEAEIAPVREVLDLCATPPEVWITEAGYSTWRHDGLRQAEAFAEALGAPASRLYWYAGEDLDPARPSQEGLHVDERHYHCGIHKSDGTPKLLARLLRSEGVEGVGPALRRLKPKASRPPGPHVLITGGAGFLGCNLADRLAGEGRRVLVYDALERPGVETNLGWLQERHGERIVPAVADIRDAYALRDAVRGADAVFHLAAQVAVTTSLDDPVGDFEVNARGTLNLLEALRAQPAPPPLLFASTNKVYGKLGGEDSRLEIAGRRWQPGDPARRRGVDEAQPLDLYSPYGCSKGVADQYVLDYARVFGLRTAVFRMSCLYGPRQFGTEDQGWVAHFLIKALRGEPVTIYGDGRQVRDALYVDDAVDAWLAALAGIDGLSGRAFNLGGGPNNTLSLLEMLDHVERLTGGRMRAAFGDWRPGDQLWYVSDTSAFAEAAGWRPKVGLGDGLARLCSWLRAREGKAEAPASPALGVPA